MNDGQILVKSTYHLGIECIDKRNGGSASTSNGSNKAWKLFSILMCRQE